MTELQASKISEFLEKKISEEEMDLVFEDLVSMISLYLATTLFGLDINRLYMEGIENNTPIEDIIKQAQHEILLSKSEISEHLQIIFEDEERSEMFATGCVESGVYDFELPNSLQKFLDEQQVSKDDYIVEMIISFQSEFYDFFTTEVNVEEWKDEIIEQILLNWE
ncbi:hypothetical protein STIUS_v1c03070 [Spiroplasma sp. TIUS-1]|uniref:hypothetical protein n=1 Tax=Spiroplasma sp. TIUS-1 TaxID=216963 RepID=UPI001397DA5A|nr:hypothetical protein [Spiroplasma sp. TIUS-1]QHX35861.1 hypothetical protein STIUS_v1c03070 [Spiroplasma sp. TIUS-1]